LGAGIPSNRLTKEGRRRTESHSRRPNEAEAKAQGIASNPYSLAPLSFDEALGRLLETDPEAVRELERRAAEKRGTKKEGPKKGARHR